LLIQAQNKPLALDEQVLMLFAGVNNWLSYINVALISEFKNSVLTLKKESFLFYPLLKAIELSFFLWNFYGVINC
jgi:F0F1-type ATP synthase alpha subunit